jgi:hypothetical protein
VETGGRIDSEISEIARQQYRTDKGGRSPAVLLICGLWVRFPPGSPVFLTKTTKRQIKRTFETLSETLTRQNCVKLRCGVCLERGQDVAVRVQRQRYLRVAERFHDRPRIDALRK